MAYTTVMAALTVLVLGLPAAAEPPPVAKENADALKAEIKERCEENMGEYGKSMVLECMKQDWQAVRKIPDYQTSHPEIAARCLRQMREYGFSMVLECIKQDADAQQQIQEW